MKGGFHLEFEILEKDILKVLSSASKKDIKKSYFKTKEMMEQISEYIVNGNIQELSNIEFDNKVFEALKVLLDIEEDIEKERNYAVGYVNGVVDLVIDVQSKHKRRQYLESITTDDLYNFLSILNKGLIEEKELIEQWGVKALAFEEFVEEMSDQDLFLKYTLDSNTYYSITNKGRELLKLRDSKNLYEDKSHLVSYTISLLEAICNAKAKKPLNSKAKDVILNMNERMQDIILNEIVVQKLNDVLANKTEDIFEIVDNHKIDVLDIYNEREDTIDYLLEKGAEYF